MNKDTGSKAPACGGSAGGSVDEKQRALDTMAAGVAHDFNNLLAAILGNASILLRGMPAEMSTRENASQIEACALRAIELTNQILICSGRSRSVDEDMSLSSLLRDMTSQLKLSVTPGIELDYEIDDDLERIKGNGKQIRQVILNLVSNASDAIDDGDGRITVATGSMHCDEAYLDESRLAGDLPAGQYVYVEIKDTGQGFGEDVKRAMFDPFFSTKLRGKGLGLAVTYGVVRAHEGTVHIESEPGQGSTFRVLLPCNETRRATD